MGRMSCKDMRGAMGHSHAWNPQTCSRNKQDIGQAHWRFGDGFGIGYAMGWDGMVWGFGLGQTVKVKPRPDHD